MHGVLDVLDLMLAQVVEGIGQAAADLIVDGAGNQHAAGSASDSRRAAMLMPSP